MTHFGWRARGLHLEIPIGRARISLSELASISMELSQHLTDRAVASAGEGGRKISCAKGCGACCRQAVPISPPEAWMLFDLVNRLAPDRQAAILRRFAAAKEILRLEGLEEAPLLSLADRYFRLGIACPFLEDESCGIYAERPAVCREYNVCSPAYMCADPQSHSIEFLPFDARMSECLAKLAGELMGWGHIMIPLVRALDWAEMHAADGKRQWDACYLLESLQSIVKASV
ncbi:MAG TPA: YkgJ family cysteine cluster protein [Acidobacteriota bacterium]|nr:YkgJ family cysteine cluster protein [Acidobacteriota bacterium]